MTKALLQLLAVIALATACAPKPDPVEFPCAAYAPTGPSAVEACECAPGTVLYFCNSTTCSGEIAAESCEPVDAIEAAWADCPDCWMHVDEGALEFGCRTYD